MRTQAKADMDHSAPETHNGRDATSTSEPSARRKSQPQNHAHEDDAVKPPAEIDAISHHTSDAAGSETTNGEHAIQVHNLLEAAGLSTDTESESVGSSISLLDSDESFQNTPEEPYASILLIRSDLDAFRQHRDSLYEFIHSHVPHPLEHYSARRSLSPNRERNQSPTSLFIHTICRQQGLLRPSTITTPGGRLALVPRGKTWTEAYTTETKNSLKNVKTLRAKITGSGGTTNVIWSRWTAIDMARTYALWFSRTPWWQGEIGAATFDGDAITDWVHFLCELFPYKDGKLWDGRTTNQEAYESLSLVLKGSRANSKSKLFEMPMLKSIPYMIFLERMPGYQQPERVMSQGALALAVPQILVLLENHCSNGFGVLGGGKIWFDIQKFRGGYFDRKGKRHNWDGSYFTFDQDEKRHRKKQHTRQARQLPQGLSIPTPEDEAPDESWTPILAESSNPTSDIAPVSNGLSLGGTTLDQFLTKLIQNFTLTNLQH